MLVLGVCDGPKPDLAGSPLLEPAEGLEGRRGGAQGPALVPPRLHCTGNLQLHPCLLHGRGTRGQNAGLLRRWHQRCLLAPFPISGCVGISECKAHHAPLTVVMDTEQLGLLSCLLYIPCFCFLFI